jgi:hypothetical protein
VQGQQGDRLGPRVQGVRLGAEGDLGAEAVQVGTAAAGQRGEQLPRGADVELRCVAFTAGGGQGLNGGPELRRGITGADSGLIATGRRL